MITQYPDTVSTEVLHNTIREVIRTRPEFDILTGEPVSFGGGSHIRLVDQFTNLGMECKSYSAIFNNYDNDSCWRMLLVDGGEPSEYIKGLGGGYYDYDEICSGGLYKLQYYKKGNNVWGTPFNFTGVETLHTSNEMKVYPNPTSETVFIETKGSAGTITFELYSADGSRVMKEDLPVGNQPIDVSCLNPGLYFYTLTVESGQRSSGKVTINR